MEVIRVGLLGLGTVGKGVFKTIQNQQEQLTKRIGKRVEIVKVLVRDLKKDRGIPIDSSLLTTSFDEVLHSDIQILIEAIGGVEPTYHYLQQAFRQGCHVVTANKELLAKKGHELIAVANQHQLQFQYEASVAGGIPILSLLRFHLTTNQITSIQGILNGTTNYILSQMEQYDREYADVLQEAQLLGYAEADPTSDVEGYDAVYKLYILTQLIYGCAPNVSQIERKGITDLSLSELKLAKEMGYTIKLIAQVQKGEKDTQLSLGVKPALVPLSSELARVNDVDNGLLLTGNIVGRLFLAGKGAGELPTASAVVEDVAFALTQEVGSLQQEWQVLETAAGQNQQQIQAEEVIFTYLRAKNKEQLFKVLEYLEKQQVSIYEFKACDTEQNHTEVGMIVSGVSSDHQLELEQNLSLSIKIYPVISAEVQGVNSEIDRIKKVVNY